MALVVLKLSPVIVFLIDMFDPKPVLLVIEGVPPSEIQPTVVVPNSPHLLPARQLKHETVLILLQQTVL